MYFAVNVRRRARSGTSGSGRPALSHQSSIGGHQRTVEGHSHVVMSPSPPSGSVILGERVPHVSLAERVAMDLHQRLIGIVLVISGGLTFAYTRAASEDSAHPDSYRCCRYDRHRCAVSSPCLRRCIRAAWIGRIRSPCPLRAPDRARNCSQSRSLADSAPRSPQARESAGGRWAAPQTSQADSAGMAEAASGALSGRHFPRCGTV